MDEKDHAKKDNEQEFRSEVCTLSMRASEDWSSVAFQLEDIRDAKMFAGEFKADDNDLSAEAIETLYSVMEEICGELKKKHDPHQAPYTFGEVISIDDISLMVGLKADPA